MAAAILAPCGQYQAALRSLGPNFIELSRAFAVSQSLALIRIGEVQKRFAAVTRQDGVTITSGQGSFERRPLKVRKVVITDEICPRIGLLAC